MIKLRVHSIGNIAIVMVLFTAVCSLLSLVCVATPELPVGETIGQWIWFGKVTLFSAGCVIVVFLLQLLRRDTWKEILFFPNIPVYVSWSLMIMGGIEAIWGLRQLFGFSVSGHLQYVLTGSFFNPGPYAGYLAMVLPICLHQYISIVGWKQVNFSRKMGKLAAVVIGFLILCVLPATMSRSAWGAAVIGCVWVTYMHRDNRKWNILWCRYKKFYISLGAGVFFIFVLGGVGIFFLKPDSALGRLFMWKITCQAIAEYPQGCNKGFAFAYGEAQENYFARGHYTEWEERVAGSPEYAFNEYLELALTKGIAVCAMMMIITLGCLRIGMQSGRYGICGAMIVLLIFSFSSYPMHLPAFIVAYVCLLLACGIGGVIGKPLILCVCFIVWVGGYNEKWRQEKNAYWKWENARMLYRSGAYMSANEAYRDIYPHLKEKRRYLFEYGHSLHKEGLYNESNEYLDEACKYSTDPMILNIMGKNYQGMHCYKQAELCLLSSVHRLPSRIYPYYLLAKLYAEPDFRNEEKFEEMKRIVLTKEPKVYSVAIEEMRKEVEEISKVLESFEK